MPEINEATQTKDGVMIVNPHLTRQASIIDSSLLAKQKIYIIGCGAIGSYAAVNLAKMGILNIEVWDNDVVSIENMNNQFFRFSDIGKNKAAALQDLILDFTGVKIKTHETKFEEGTAIHSFFNNEDAIMISAVDSMGVRKLIFDEIVSNEMGNNVRFIIDPRMSAEAYLQFSCRMDKTASMENYAKSLYTDEAAVQERCTAKSTIYTATSAAAMVCKTVKNIIMGEQYPKMISWDIKSSNPDSLTMFAHS